MPTPPRRLVSASILAIAVLGLSACGKGGDERTAGQKLDSAVAKVEQKTDAAMAKVEEKTDKALAEVKKDMKTAGSSGAKALAAASGKLKDAAITTGVNAELAKDSSLSALRINVDTNAGHVALKGTAPDASAKDRATVLAQRVDGVVGVDNQLEIRSN